MTSGKVGRAAQAAVAIAMAGALVAAAPPQDRWEQQVRLLLERAASTTAESGFVETHRARVGSLRDGQAESWTVTLNAGTEYRLVGVCDVDCSDFDLKLLNQAGTTVSEDVETDDVPVLTIVPPRTQEYTVRAIMADCETSPCRYGVGVYGR